MEKKTSFSPVPSLVSSEGSDSVWGGWESDAEGWKFWHFVEGDQMPLESCRSHLGEHEVVPSEDFPRERRRFPHQSKPRTNRESFRKLWLVSRASWIKRVHTNLLPLNSEVLWYSLWRTLQGSEHEGRSGPVVLVLIPGRQRWRRRWGWLFSPNIGAVLVENQQCFELLDLWY